MIETLELEAADPRVAELHRLALALRRAIEAVLEELAGPRRVDRDCPGCLLSPATCDAVASAGGGRCCDECRHG